jgi:hypothetical protein
MLLSTPLKFEFSSSSKIHLIGDNAEFSVNQILLPKLICCPFWMPIFQLSIELEIAQGTPQVVIP